MIGWQVVDVGDIAAGRDGGEKQAHRLPLPAAHVSFCVETCLRQGTVTRGERPGQRKVVLIMDGEMGAKAVAERLRGLGLDPDTAHARVTHVNLSAVGQGQWADFVVWARAMCFALVIWDPIVHHLAGAGLNEDSNSDVQLWITKVVNPLLSGGATVVGVDHLAKNGDSNGYARGASAKKASSRLVYEFKKDNGARFDRDTLGEVLVALVKNSDAALIPAERIVVLGGQEQTDKFILRVSERAPSVQVDRRRDDARAVVDKVVAVLES